MQEEYLRMRLQEIVDLIENLREELDDSFEYMIGLSTLNLSDSGDTEMTRMAYCTYDLIEMYDEMDEAFRQIVMDNFMASYPQMAYQTDSKNAIDLSKMGIMPYCLN